MVFEGAGDNAHYNEQGIRQTISDVLFNGNLFEESQPSLGWGQSCLAIRSGTSDGVLSVWHAVESPFA